MIRQWYGVCDCGKWGEAPKAFKESKHFMQCECGKSMYLDSTDPRTVAYKESNKIVITKLINHNG